MPRRRRLGWHKGASAVARSAARHGQSHCSSAVDRTPGASSPRRAKPAESRRSQSVTARCPGRFCGVFRDTGYSGTDHKRGIPGQTMNKSAEEPHVRDDLSLVTPLPRCHRLPALRAHPPRSLFQGRCRPRRPVTPRGAQSAEEGVTRRSGVTSRTSGHGGQNDDQGPRRDGLPYTRACQPALNRAPATGPSTQISWSKRRSGRIGAGGSGTARGAVCAGDCAEANRRPGPSPGRVCPAGGPKGCGRRGRAFGPAAAAGRRWRAARLALPASARAIVRAGGGHRG
jgi:hypothetical protein